ncbi:hypothetical protein HPB50_003879 [Hyalomma asiaticum]|uniref:Uncharacterized protein n=1 Tax=Hyalomma asiaticum TaxID=266040 RepID=A0ACB7RVC4_HYAAI|nr:hypothetical protein HPB50_003879 [Hyalomma asiaticum]
MERPEARALPEPAADDGDDDRCKENEDTLQQQTDDLRQDTVKLLQASPGLDGPLESTVFARSPIIRLGVATRYE